MTSWDPASQPTPTRVDEILADGLDEQTILRGRPTPPPASAPAASSGWSHPGASEPQVWNPDAADATHYAERPGPPDAAEQSTQYSPRSGARLADSSIPPVSGPPAQDVPRGNSGAWAPSNWHLPEDRYAAPPPVVERRRQAPSAVKLLSWSLAVVLLAVAAGFIYVRFIRTPPEDEAVKVPVSSGSASKAVVLRGDEVVRGYLTALAAGDVTKALTYGPTGGNGSQNLLSKDAYARSLKATPISNIDVPTVDANATEVPATYMLGKEQVKTSFRVVKQDDGSWLMEKTTTTFRVQGTNVDSVPLKINGVTIGWETPVELVPGTYTLSTGLPFIAFDEKSGLKVINLNYSEVTVHNAAPVLTAAGQKALIEAGQRTLAACVSRKEPAPQNCPQNLATDAPFEPQSIVWKLQADPFTGARPGLRATDQSRAELNVVVRLTLSAKIKGQQRYINDNPHTIPANISADMTVTTAELVRPEWRS